MTPEARLAQINQTLEAVRSGWPFLRELMRERAESLTLDLIGTNNDETRGRIKELRLFMELPESLQAERAGIEAALAD